MPSRRLEFREMAIACLENSETLYLDALALGDRGSTGHARSLLVLSIEEAVKSIIYRAGFDGLVYISKDPPRTPYDVQESELLRHKFKHRLLAAVILDRFYHSPIVQLLEDAELERIGAVTFRRLYVKAEAAHNLMMTDMEDLSSPKTIQVHRFLTSLEHLDEEKNLGFYVDKRGKRIHRPNEIPSSSYAYWSGFQKGFLESTKAIVNQGFDRDIGFVLSMATKTSKGKTTKAKKGRTRASS